MAGRYLRTAIAGGVEDQPGDNAAMEGGPPISPRLRPDQVHRPLHRDHAAKIITAFRINCSTTRTCRATVRPPIRGRALSEFTVEAADAKVWKKAKVKLVKATRLRNPERSWT
jgi:hypothetical protein